jgi:hypothetical protein
VGYAVLGSYDPVFWGLAGASMLAALVMLAVRGTDRSLAGTRSDA